MKHSAVLFSLIAAFPVAQGIAFGGIAPTASNPERALYGTTPKPTNGPSVAELRKRQTNFNQETCGWVDGNYNQAVTCPGALTCMLYKSATVGMAGCCSGSDSQDCGWSNSCVDAKAYAAGKCDSNCMLNSFVRKCTAAAAPYCVTWSYPSDGVLDYGCTALSSNTVRTVLQRGTDAFSDSTSIKIPTLSGNAVTLYSTDVPSGSGSSSRKTGKKIAIGLIVGVVIAGLFVLFFIIIAVCFVLKKKKKQRQLAENAQAVAAMQANRPQSQFPPPQYQQQMQMQQPSAIPPQQSPHPTTSGYFQPSVPLEQKTNAQASVHEYAASPISNPPTPAPAYIQPQYSVPAMPSNQTPAMNQHHNSGNTPHEVDAISVPRPPVHGEPVYEIGQGR